MRPKTLILIAVLIPLFGMGFVARKWLFEAPPPPRLLPFDEVMFATTASSGGDFYFWERGEFAGSKLRIPIGGDDVLLAYPVLDGEQTFEFPVDSLTTRLEVFAGAQELLDLRLFDRHGRVGLSRGGIEFQEFGRMRLATILNPSPGPWRLEIEGNGQLSLSVSAATDANALPPSAGLAAIHLVGYEQVETRTAEVTLSGSIYSAKIGVIGADGLPLPRTAWGELEFLEGTNRAAGALVVPRIPHRVVVRGRDMNGLPFQRVLPWLQGLPD